MRRPVKMRCRFLVALTVLSSVSLQECIGQEGAPDTIIRDDDQVAIEEINSQRADRWPSDLEMQNYCYEANASARNRAQSYALIDGPVELTIWRICAARWTDQKHRVDWEMMEDCLDEQVGALQVAQRRRRR